MTGQLRGRLADKRPNQVLVDVGGVGYVVLVPLSTFTALDELLEQSHRDPPTVSEWTRAACQSPAQSTNHAIELLPSSRRPFAD
jgi:hypothetical protein